LFAAEAKTTMSGGVQGVREKTTGVVKWFNAAKGFGFIGKSEGGEKDIFLHGGELKKSGLVPEDVGEGDVLSFEVQDAPRGPKAVNIERVAGE
jgi:CspA family cold shock protein